MSESFLPKFLVMVDCEMSGVRSSHDELLQVSALKLKLEGSQYQVYDDHFDEYLAYPGVPTRQFHKDHLVHIFKKCNESKTTPAQLKEKLHKWLGSLKGDVIPTGDCVPTDIAFLKAKNCIDEQFYGDDDKPIKGTFHYEYWDMNALKDLSRTIHGSKYEVDGVDKEHEHDGLIDCYNQVLELNASIRVILGGKL